MTFDQVDAVRLQFNRLIGRGGNCGFIKVSAIVRETGAKRDDIIKLAIIDGVECAPHGKHGYCVHRVWPKGA